MTAIVCLACRRIRNVPLDRYGRLTPPACSCGEPGWTTLEAADADRAGVAICCATRGASRRSGSAG